MNQNDKKIDIFENYPVYKALITLALPTILGMLVNVFYNMVDTFFVGQTNDPNQVAAVSLTMPIYLVLMSFGSIYGIGGASYISRSLGARKKDISRVFNAETFIIGVTSGLIGIFIAWLLLFPTNSILFNLTELENVAVMNPIHAVILIAVSVTLTLIGGFIPAKIASKKDPVIALRTE